MVKRSWTIELERPADPDHEAFSTPKRSTYTIDLDHNYWTTRRRIRVNGLPLTPAELRSNALYGEGSDDLFTIDGNLCHIQARPFGLSYRYELAINFISVLDGKPVVPRPETWQAESQTGIPLWAWPLLPLSVVIPALVYVWAMFMLIRPEQVQGAIAAHLIPGLVVAPLATVAVYKIIRVSRNSTRSVASRVLGCLKAIAWTTLLSTLVSIGALLLLVRDG